MLLANHRVERPGRAVDGRDAQSAVGERAHETVACRNVGEELSHTQVWGRRLTADGDLDATRADAGGQVQRGLERELRHRIRIETQLHRVSPSCAEIAEVGS